MRSFFIDMLTTSSLIVSHFTLDIAEHIPCYIAR